MWAGVLFFLFCVGFVFYVFEHVNSWIQRDQKEQSINNVKDKIIKHISGSTAINMDLGDGTFLSSKFIFKKVNNTFETFNHSIAIHCLH